MDLTLERFITKASLCVSAVSPYSKVVNQQGRTYRITESILDIHCLKTIK